MLDTQSPETERRGPRRRPDPAGSQREPGQEARADRAASGEFQPRPCRPVVRAQRLSPRHPQAALRRAVARDHGQPLRRGDLRRAHERQRQGRVHSHRDRLDRRDAEGEGAVPRHLPRRADAGDPSRRQGRLRSGGPRGDRLLPAASRRRTAAGSGLSRITSTNGTARAASCRAGARLLATSTGAFPNQAFAYGPAAFGVQFHPEITYAQVHRWTGHNNTRLQMKGARERQQHIDGHVVHGPKVRAWLGGFLDRWVKAGIFRRTYECHRGVTQL